MDNNRLGKTELAQILGGAFISDGGAINSRKLRTFVCGILAITENEYKKNHVFTAAQIRLFQEKNVFAKSV